MTENFYWNNSYDFKSNFINLRRDYSRVLEYFHVFLRPGHEKKQNIANLHVSKECSLVLPCRMSEMIKKMTPS